MKQRMTLCIIHQDGQVLLGMKKRGFGAGKWNGFGGKCTAGEPLVVAAARELKEESGLAAGNIVECGVIDFVYPAHGTHEVYVFRVADHRGLPVETEEMRPQWFAADALPFSSMWPSDAYWLPLLLAGKSFTGEVVFDLHDQILSCNIGTH